MRANSSKDSIMSDKIYYVNSIVRFEFRPAPHRSNCPCLIQISTLTTQANPINVQERWKISATTEHRERK